MDWIRSYFFFTPVKLKNVLFIESVFVVFFGFFAVLAFGRDKNSSDLLQTIQSSFQSVGAIELRPVLGIFVLRLSRTAHEILSSGVFGGRRRSVVYRGTGGMWILLFLVMTAPFIADKSPNTVAGLTVIVILKVLGEVLTLLFRGFPNSQLSTIADSTGSKHRK